MLWGWPILDSSWSPVARWPYRRYLNTGINLLASVCSLRLPVAMSTTTFSMPPALSWEAAEPNHSVTSTTLIIAVAATASATPSSSLLFDMSASPQAPIDETPDRQRVAGRAVYRIRILINQN